MVTNKDVTIAWVDGHPLQSNHLRTNGSDLYSYTIKIGYRYGGYNIAINYMGGHMYSMTTSHHVALAKQVADRVIDPCQLIDKLKTCNLV